MLTRSALLETEKAVAVWMRREHPDLLPSTDAWRPIVRQIIELAGRTAQAWEGSDREDE
jgi:hypothetical protein